MKPIPIPQKPTPKRETWIRLTTRHGPAAVEQLVTESVDGEVCAVKERKVLWQQQVRSAALGRADDALNETGGER